MPDGGVHAAVLNVMVGDEDGLGVADVCQALGIPVLFATGH
jgi:hypothetical protein